MRLLAKAPLRLRLQRKRSRKGRLLPNSLHQRRRPRKSLARLIKRNGLNARRANRSSLRLLLPAESMNPTVHFDHLRFQDDVERDRYVRPNLETGEPCVSTGKISPGMGSTK